MDIENEYEGAERAVVEEKLPDRLRRTRRKNLHVRLSEAEDEKMSEIEESTGLNRAAAIRKWILDKRLPNRPAKDLVTLLRQEGKLFKHTAYGPGREISKETGAELLRRSNVMMDIAARIEDGLTHGGDDNQ